MQSINKYGMQAGIVKIIPPQQWLDALPPITEKISSVKIKNPIIQNINGAKGVYISENMERHRTYTMADWKKIALMPNNRPPVPRGSVKEVPKKRRRKTSSASPEAVHQEVPVTEDVPLKRKLRDHSKDTSQQTSVEQIKEADFDYNIDVSEYDQERCEFLEANYWKTLSYAHPMYGADCLGSIFDDTLQVWNVAHLPNVLDHLDQQIPGVNEAYLYAGLWKASFAWHLEDQDLYSINYIHFGAPKHWYSIPQAQAQQFYDIMKETFPESYKQCTEFLRHKTFVVSPQFLESKGVQVNSIVHREREFIVTFPYGYHAGFNYDYNLAESVNFALEEWLDIGLNSAKCECISDSVGIDVESLISKIKNISRKKNKKEKDGSTDLVSESSRQSVKV